MNPAVAAKPLPIPWRELAVPFAILAIVLAMVSPVPAPLLDLLISANIAITIVILLVSVYVGRPMEFSLFPTILLIMTLFRLALNVSSSRLILLNGNTGTAASGRVIEAFGQFVVGGNYVIGCVIFLVLIAIQYVVINHGAVRISEVTARFTLDALPGKQMAIDADLNNGLIDEAEARRRRRELSSEAEFYGAMDGASRFTQRDAMASILITLINIFAGLLIGTLQQGMEPVRALQTYAILTIGDGLVTVIPALMISVSGGLIITRASTETKLGQEVESQLLERWQPLLLGGAVIAAIGLLPGLPSLPFLGLGGAAGWLGWQRRAEEQKRAAEPPPPPPPKNRDDLETMLRVEPVSITVGVGLVRMLEGGASSPLLRKISAFRKQLASDLGFILPAVRVADDFGLKAREYVISLRGVEAGRFELLPGHELAMEAGQPARRMDGIPTQDPAFGMPALWIATSLSDDARRAGYTVVDGLSVLATHFGEVIRRAAHEMFTRQDAKRFLDRVGEENPKAVEELSKNLPLPTIQRVIQNLLREKVSIRDGASIVESIGEAAGFTRNQVLLTEYVRQSLRRQLVRPYLNSAGALPVYFLDAALEKRLESAVEHGESVSNISLNPADVRQLIRKVEETCGTAGLPAVILTTATLRYFLRQILEAELGNVHALSHSEVPIGTKLVSLGMIR